MAISRVALVPMAQLGHLQVIIMFPRNTDNWFIPDPRLLHVLRFLLMMESTKFLGGVGSRAQLIRHECRQCITKITRENIILKRKNNRETAESVTFQPSSYLFDSLERKVARVTALEPATSGVTGR